MVRKLILCAMAASLAGCSATSLRCGVEDDRSYVDLVNVPQDIAGQARYFAELCAFAYEGDSNET